MVDILSTSTLNGTLSIIRARPNTIGRHIIVMENQIQIVWLLIISLLVRNKERHTLFLRLQTTSMGG